jgi:hypothetical protein
MAEDLILGLAEQPAGCQFQDVKQVKYAHD